MSKLPVRRKLSLQINGFSSKKKLSVNFKDPCKRSFAIREVLKSIEGFVEIFVFTNHLGVHGKGGMAIRKIITPVTFQVIPRINGFIGL